MSKSDTLEGTLSMSSQWRDFWAREPETTRSLCAAANQGCIEDEKFRRTKERKFTRQEIQSLSKADAGSLQSLLDDAQAENLKRRGKNNLIKRAGRHTVIFANNFSNFLQAYSGIVDIMRGADQQSGGVAYATLSIILIIAVNKQQNEERIETTLLTLQREFSRIKVLRDIYSSESMKRYICDAFDLGLEFAREATIYYARPTYRRVLEAVTKPPQLGVDLKISAITAVMLEIEKESHTLNSQRLHQVQQQLDRVKEEVHRVNKGVEGIATHINHEKASLSMLKDQLLPVGYDADLVLDKYSSDVEQSFKNPGRLSLLDMEKVMLEPVFQQWEKSQTSCIFLLQGRTAITVRDYSWLSPAIYHLIKLFRDRNCPVIFHCCHDRIHMEPDTPIHGVLSSLVFQMLKLKSSILRDLTRCEDLKREFSNTAWRAGSGAKAFSVLNELLKSFPEVYIFLDRIDRIKGDPDRFLDPLAELIKRNPQRIKVFLVASSNNQYQPEGKITQDLLDNLTDSLGPDKFFSLTANQQ